MQEGVELSVRPLQFVQGVLLVALLTAGTVLGQDHSSVAATELDAFLESQRLEMDAPGMSAAIAHRGRVIYAGAAGLAEVANGVAASARTVYNIGSVSKVNAVIAIMKLVEQGRVDVDDPIQTWVPDFPEKSPTITLRHVLTHTSGIRHYLPTDFGRRENKERYDSIQDAIEIFREDELLFPPGALWSYSSYATNMLQAVVEETTGVGFEEFLHDAVWSPAGMLTTGFDVPERIISYRARGYRREPPSGRLMHEPYGDLSYKFAGGGMISTVLDQVRLGAALNSGRLLTPEVVEMMYTPLEPPPKRFDPVRDPQSIDFGQGLIWRVETDAQGRRVVSHTGSVVGFRTALLNYPEDDLVVAVMVNIASRPRDTAFDLANFAFAHLVADEGRAQ